MRSQTDFRVVRVTDGAYRVLMDGKPIATEESQYRSLDDVKLLVCNVLELLYRGAWVSTVEDV